MSAPAVARERCEGPDGRERLLLAVGDVADRIVGRTILNEDWRGLLEVIGRVVEATSVSAWELVRAANGTATAVERQCWCAFQQAPAGNRAVCALPAGWHAAFVAGEPVLGSVNALPAPERDLPPTARARSVALLPVPRRHGPWGFLAFADSATEAAWPAPVVAQLQRVCRIIGAALDRCDLCHRQQAIEASYHALLDNLSEGIFMTDERGNFTYLNGAWLTLTGVSPNDSIGRFCAAFAAPADRYALRRELVALLNGTMHEHRCEVRLLRADGTTRWVQISARERQVAGRACGGLVGTVVDISANKETERKLIVAMAEVEAASRAKSEFLSTMNHELRTPLNAVIGLSESLLETLPGEGGEARTRRFLELIHQGGRQLYRQINDILDLARIEAGRLKLNITEVEVGAVCTVACDSVRREAEAKGLRLVCQPVRATILADERLIGLALYNLLANAVKFTPAGGRVGVDVTLLSAGGVSIQVSDTGIGIPADKLHLLFKPFSQVDSSLSRRFGGTGLGLVLVDKYVRMHGGSVSVLSDSATGSTFTLELPARPPSHPDSGAGVSGRPTPVFL